MTQQCGTICHAMLYVTEEMRKKVGTSIYKQSAKRLGKFVTHIEGSLYQTPPFNKFFGKLPKCSLYPGIVNIILGYKTQHFRIWKIIVITFQYRAYSYGTVNLRRGKQNCYKLLYTYIFSLLVCLAFFFYHMLTFIRYIEANFMFALVDCVRYDEDFVKLKFCSIHSL